MRMKIQHAYMWSCTTSMQNTNEMLFAFVMYIWNCGTTSMQKVKNYTIIVRNDLQ